MKRLKTFKQLRRGESTTTDANTMQLEEINGKLLFYPKFNYIYDSQYIINM